MVDNPMVKEIQNKIVKLGLLDRIEDIKREGWKGRLLPIKLYKNTRVSLILASRTKEKGRRRRRKTEPLNWNIPGYEKQQII